MNNITPEEAHKIIDSGKAVFIDVRTPAEFADGHIHGAMNIDIHSDGFEDEVRKLDPHALYIINCQSGGRSSRACSIFEELGFTSAMNLEGGIMAWKGAGLPVEQN